MNGCQCDLETWWKWCAAKCHNYIVGGRVNGSHTRPGTEVANTQSRLMPGSFTLLTTQRNYDRVCTELLNRVGLYVYVHYTMAEACHVGHSWGRYCCYILHSNVDDTDMCSNHTGPSKFYAGHSSVFKYFTTIQCGVRLLHFIGLRSIESRWVEIFVSVTLCVWSAYNDIGEARALDHPSRCEAGQSSQLVLLAGACPSSSSSSSQETCLIDWPRHHFTIVNVTRNQSVSWRCRRTATPLIDLLTKQLCERHSYQTASLYKTASSDLRTAQQQLYGSMLQKNCQLFQQMDTIPYPRALKVRWKPNCSGYL